MRIRIACLAVAFLGICSNVVRAAPDDVCKNAALSHQQQVSCKEEITHANTKSERRAAQLKYRDRIAATGQIQPDAKEPSNAANAQGLEVDDLRVILNVLEPTTMTVFLKITNHGEQLDRLVGLYSPLCESVRIETPVWRGYRMHLEILDAVDLPPGHLTEFQPGKYKITLVGMKEHMRPNTKVPLELQFEKAGRVETTLKVVNKLLDN